MNVTTPPLGTSRRLVTVGESLVLLSSAGEPARLRHADLLRLSVGGAESNVAIGVCRLGGEATWIGRVADDELGELIMRTLRAERVDVDAVRRERGTTTSLMIKERRSATSTHVTYYRHGGPGSRLQPDDLDVTAIRTAGILHLTGITPALSPSARATVRAAAEIAAEAGTPISLDFNYRAALWQAEEAGPELRDLCTWANHAFVGEHEAAALGFRGDARHIAREVAALGPRTVIVKLGERGAVARCDDEEYVVKAVAVPCVDPVGAGDAFAAGYLTEMLAGEPLHRRLRTAVACGALAVTARGDWEGLPTREELDQLDREGDEVVR